MKSLSNFFLSAGKATIPVLIVLLSIKCSEPADPDVGSSGHLNLLVGISVDASDIKSHLKAAEPEEFVVFIHDESGTEVQSFPRAADIPSAIDLTVGNYYVAAHSNNNLPAAFENDYYYGESELFTVSAGDTTEVSLTCGLANIRVSVVYSSSVVSSFEDYETVISNADGSLSFGAGETRAGYFDQGPLSIEAHLYYSEGGEQQELVLTGSIADAEAGRHYEVVISAATAAAGAAIELLVDESYETEVISLSDEEAPMSGELLITEIMYNPAAIGDAEGEYIELKNVSAASVNLNGLVIRRGSNNDTHVIADDLPLAPGEIILLARSAAAADQVDYVYSSISLLNSGDVLYLNHYGTDGTDGEVICRIDYGAAGFPTSLSGQSIQLDPSVSDVEDALMGTNWCAGTAAFSTGDLGSPGVENGECF